MLYSETVGFFSQAVCRFLDLSYNNGRFILEENGNKTTEQAQYYRKNSSAFLDRGALVLYAEEEGPNRAGLKLHLPFSSKDIICSYEKETK